MPSRAMHHLELKVRVLGRGRPLVLLHGLLAGSRSWGLHYEQLADECRLIVPDLPGFGRSPRSDAHHGLVDDARAVMRVLEALDAREPAVIVGHCFGSLVGLQIAASWPERTAAVVMFGPPLYPDARSGVFHLAFLGGLVRLGLVHPRLARWLCELTSAHRAVAATLAALLYPSLPRPLGAEAVTRRWSELSMMMQRELLGDEGSLALDAVAAPVTMVIGVDDPVVDVGHLGAVADANDSVSLVRWPGDHYLPLADPERCVRFIRDLTTALGDIPAVDTRQDGAEAGPTEGRTRS